jgi:hypothetical protein
LPAQAVLAVTAETPVWRVLVALVPRRATLEPLASAAMVVPAAMAIPQSQQATAALLVVPVATAARPRIFSPVMAARVVTAEQAMSALTQPPAAGALLVPVAASAARAATVVRPQPA